MSCYRDLTLDTPGPGEPEGPDPGPGSCACRTPYHTYQRTRLRHSVRWARDCLPPDGIRGVHAASNAARTVTAALGTDNCGAAFRNCADVAVSAQSPLRARRCRRDARTWPARRCARAAWPAARPPAGPAAPRPAATRG